MGLFYIAILFVVVYHNIHKKTEKKHSPTVQSFVSASPNQEDCYSISLTMLAAMSLIIAKLIKFSNNNPLNF